MAIGNEPPERSEHNQRRLGISGYVMEVNDMPKLHSKGELITPEEFQRWLEKAQKESTLIGDLREIIEEMVIMEQKYGMTSEQFYEKFSRGEMGNDMDVIDWAGNYKVYCRAKEIIEKKLTRLDEWEEQLNHEDTNQIGTISE